MSHQEGPENSEQNVIAKGFLHKLGKNVKNWKLRFFVVYKSGLVEYYGSKGAWKQRTTPKGSFRIASNWIAETGFNNADMNKHGLLITLRCNDVNERVWALTAASTDERQTWMKIFSQLIEQLGGQQSKHSQDLSLPTTIENDNNNNNNELTTNNNNNNNEPRTSSSATTPIRILPEIQPLFTDCEPVFEQICAKNAVFVVGVGIGHVTPTNHPSHIMFHAMVASALEDNAGKFSNRAANVNMNQLVFDALTLGNVMGTDIETTLFQRLGPKYYECLNALSDLPPNNSHYWLAMSLLKGDIPVVLSVTRDCALDQALSDIIISNNNNNNNTTTAAAAAATTNNSNSNNGSNGGAGGWVVTLTDEWSENAVRLQNAQQLRNAVLTGNEEEDEKVRRITVIVGTSSAFAYTNLYLLPLLGGKTHSFVFKLNGLPGVPLSAAPSSEKRAIIERVFDVIQRRFSCVFWGITLEELQHSPILLHLHKASANLMWLTQGSSSGLNELITELLIDSSNNNNSNSNNNATNSTTTSIQFIPVPASQTVRRRSTIPDPKKVVRALAKWANSLDPFWCAVSLLDVAILCTRGSIDGEQFLQQLLGFLNAPAPVAFGSHTSTINRMLSEQQSQNLAIRDQVQIAVHFDEAMTHLHATLTTSPTKTAQNHNLHLALESIQKAHHVMNTHPLSPLVCPGSWGVVGSVAAVLLAAGQAKESLPYLEDAVQLAKLWDNYTAVSTCKRLFALAKQELERQKVANSSTTSRLFRAFLGSETDENSQFAQNPTAHDPPFVHVTTLQQSKFCVILVPTNAKREIRRAELNLACLVADVVLIDVRMLCRSTEVIEALCPGGVVDVDVACMLRPFVPSALTPKDNIFTAFGVENLVDEHYITVLDKFYRQNPGFVVTYNQQQHANECLAVMKHKLESDMTPFCPSIAHAVLQEVQGVVNREITKVLEDNPPSALVSNILALYAVSSSPSPKQSKKQPLPLMDRVLACPHTYGHVIQELLITTHLHALSRAFNTPLFSSAKPPLTPQQLQQQQQQQHPLTVSEEFPSVGASSTRRTSPAATHLHPTQHTFRAVAYTTNLNALALARLHVDDIVRLRLTAECKALRKSFVDPAGKAPSSAAISSLGDVIASKLVVPGTRPPPQIGEGFAKAVCFAQDMESEEETMVARKELARVVREVFVVVAQNKSRDGRRSTQQVQLVGNVCDNIGFSSLPFPGLNVFAG